MRAAEQAPEEAALSINRTTCSHEPDYIAIQIQIGKRVIKLEISPHELALAMTGVSERPCKFAEHNRAAITQATQSHE